MAKKTQGIVNLSLCSHKRSALVDQRYQCYWCPDCGAIKTPSAVTSGNAAWKRPTIVKEYRIATKAHDAHATNVLRLAEQRRTLRDQLSRIAYSLGLETNADAEVQTVDIINAIGALRR